MIVIVIGVFPPYKCLVNLRINAPLRGSGLLSESDSYCNDSCKCVCGTMHRAVSTYACRLLISDIGFTSLMCLCFCVSVGGLEGRGCAPAFVRACVCACTRARVHIYGGPVCNSACSRCTHDMYTHMYVHVYIYIYREREIMI